MSCAGCAAVEVLSSVRHSTTMVDARCRVSTTGCHRTEEVTAAVVGERTGCVVVEAMAAIAVVVVDGEVPATVGEHDGTVEVAVAYQTIPSGDAEEGAEGEVAGFAHRDIVIVVVADGHFVEVAVHAPDVVVVDAVHLVDEEGVGDAKGVSHAVGQEPCIVAHSGDAHALSVHCCCSEEDNDSCECSS